MINPFYTNSFILRAKHMESRPNTWRKDMEEAGLQTPFQLIDKHTEKAIRSVLVSLGNISAMNIYFPPGVNPPAASPSPKTIRPVVTITDNIGVDVKASVDPSGGVQVTVNRKQGSEDRSWRRDGY